MSAMAPKPFAPKPFISKSFAPKPLAPKPFAPKTTRRGTGLSSDAALGLVGCSLAAASATFGIVMTMHGPVATLGRSGNFTVFAQLAPRAPAPVAPVSAAPATVAPVSAAPVADPPDVASDRDLDLTATASIPTRTAPTSERAAASTVTLQDASSEAATIKVDGRTVVVRVGDTIPGVGDVLAIIPGATPMLRTTGGVIAAATPER